MSEVDELQTFIADCEWKTRKIPRDSNKRVQDNARSVAVKERVEKLKQKGTSVSQQKQALLRLPRPSIDQFKNRMFERKR